MFEWREGIWLGVSAIVTAMLITLVITFGSVAKESAKLQQNELNSKAQMQELAKWIKYDNSIVDSAEVINCIVNNKSEKVSIIVKKVMSFDNPNEAFNFNLTTLNQSSWDIKNSSYMWDGKKIDESKYPDYTFDALSQYIPPQSLYRAHIEKDLNGAVKYIWFKRIPMWTVYENIKINGSDLIDCILESKGHDFGFDFVLEYIDPVANKPVSFKWEAHKLTDDVVLSISEKVKLNGIYSATIFRNGQSIFCIGFKLIEN